MASSGDHSFENPPTNTPTGQPSLIVEIIPFPLPLDEFIVNSNPNTSSSSWNKVYEALGVTFSNSSGSLNAKVTSFWDTTFSSTENENKFGPSNGSATAVGGDENPSSAVFGMILPTSGALTTPLKFSEVREKFGINNSNANSSLISLLDAVDRAGALMITLDQDPKARNALWIVPKDAYKVIMNMVFTIANEEAIRGLESYIKASYGITISISARNCRFEFQQTSFFIPNLPKRPGLGTNPEFIRSSKYRMVVSFQVASFEVSIICTPDDMEFYFSDPPNALVTGNIIDRLNSAIVNGSGMSSNGFPDSSAANPFSKILKDVNLWYINIGREVIGHTAATPTQPSIPEYGSLYWSIKLFGKWEVGASSETILLGLSYDSRDQTFFGQLLFQADLPTDMVKRQHGFFWVTDDIPFSVREKLRTRGIPRSLNLLGLFSQSIKAPKGVPLELTQGYIAFRRGDNGSGTELSFGTNIKSQIAVEENEAAAPFGFSWDEIAAQVAIQDTGTTSTTDIVISTSINLRGGADIPPATLSVDVEYSTGGFWVLHGRLENLSLALLAKFFHKNNREMAKGLLGTLRLRYADVIYTFNSSGETAGEPSSFVITGALVLGGLELDLTYEFASALIDSSQSAAKIAQESGQLPSDRETLRPSGGESQWSFEADLGASTTGATLGTIIGSFSPNAISSLPTFVTNIDVAPAAGGKAPIKLKLASVGNTTAGSGVSPGSGLILIFVVSMLDTTFTYISLNQRGVTKRVLQVNADQIPIVSDIPLVKVLPPPFDELRYLWVDTPTPVGLSKDEINQINAELEKGKMAKLAYKETSKDSGASAGPVLQTGHHFMVLQGGKVILDHVFGKPNPDSPDPTNPGGSGNAQDPPPTKGAIDKQTPFLTIDGIQLQFKAPVLHIEISATIVLGPINFSVIGFDIGFNLENIKLNNLAALLSPGLISVGLHGLAVKVDKPPVTMSGVFIHEDINAGGVVAESYRGGIAFGFQAWQFMAVGEYRIVTQPQNYKSVFVYAKLDGPLITLAFATVSGVRVGFGYNSIVRSPTLLELPQFPFLNSSADKEAGNDPMKILTAMMGDGNNAPWVSAKEDSYWVAAGVTLTAFGLLAVTAVLMVGFRDGGAVISVFADGIAQMPPGVSANACLVYIEIGMLAELNTIDGYFTVQAALAPTSHLIVASCRLTGGFALTNWFRPSQHSGDFVLTVGGYHRAYKPPPWYPVVPRLGVSFTLEDMINVTGVAYFAITPKCVMGGGALHLGLDVGPVSAWLDVILDVFIQFDPFMYMADLAVSVGCAITIKVWFVHIRISVSVGAALHIEGPDPFRGSANVEFYLFSFTVHFGRSPTIEVEKKSLPQFYEMVKSPGPSTPAPSDSSVRDEQQALVKFTVSTGLIPPAQTAPRSDSGQFPSTGATATWLVKSGTFSCNIGFEFAISSAHIRRSNDVNTTVVELFPKEGASAIKPFWSKPMQLTSSNPISSSVEVKVWMLNLADPEKNTPIDAMQGELVTKDVPAALWGAYDRAEDPIRTGNPSATTAALSDPREPTMNLCMAINLWTLPGVLLPSPITDIDASAAFRRYLDPTWFNASPVEQKILRSSGVLYSTESPSERWAHVVTDWQNFAATGSPVLESSTLTEGEVQGSGLLKSAAKYLGWDKPSPKGAGSDNGNSTDGRKKWMLNAKPAKRMMKSLPTSYPVLFRYSAVTA